MSKVNIIIAAVILILLLIIFAPGYSKLQKLKGINEDLTKENKELTIENTNLEIEIKKLTEDPLYIEEVARKKMGISKEGEVIYRIIEDENVDE